MSYLKSLYHFLGGITFAIFLIATVAICVIIGTFLEAHSDSHRYAAYFTYQNPFFIALLWGFFINILFSALRRWPFKFKHLPFLITHLGLLMILAGTLAKSYFGTQGTMTLIEGSGSHKLTIADSYALYIEKQSKDSSLIANSIPLQVLTDASFDRLDIHVSDLVTHSKEQFHTWIKGPKGKISGYPSFAVFDLNNRDEIPISTALPLQETQLWNIIAGHTIDISHTLAKAYAQQGKIILINKQTQQLFYEGSLQNALANGIQSDEGKIHLSLTMNESSLTDTFEPILTATFPLANGFEEQTQVALHSTSLLQTQSINTPFFGSPQWDITLVFTPTILLLKDPLDDLHLFAFDPQGRIHRELFQSDTLHSLIMYDRGFGGYAVQAHIPFDNTSKSREEIEQLRLVGLKEKLKDTVKDHRELAPPLKLIADACQQHGEEFSSTCIDFLSEWDKCHDWIIPEDHALPPKLASLIASIDWKQVPDRDYKACFWIHTLYKEIGPRLKQGEDLLNLLTTKGWPLVNHLNSLKSSKTQCTPDETAKILIAMAQQLFSVADQLPDHDIENTLSARLLTAYLRAYDIHLDTLPVPPPQKQKGIDLESPLSASFETVPPLQKLEDNIPRVTLEIRNGTEGEKISLAFDRSCQGLKWPIFYGSYLLRFQPHQQQLPYHVRLRHARQVNYANSNQPYSYESDLIITDLADNSQEEVTISMNHVYETWSGYRFYLSNIIPNENGAKRIQLVVNHDPAKYLLTYTGALILTLGILLLFWFNPYKNKK